MVDRERLARFIQELEKYLGQLSELQKMEKQEYLNNWRMYYVVDRTLHLALETFLNIGEIVITECKFRKPDTYADIPRILQENGVIPKELEEKLIDLAKFRNVLVHEYLYLNHEIVYKHLKTDPDIIKKYLSYVKKFIRGKK